MTTKLSRWTKAAGALCALSALFFCASFTLLYMAAPTEHTARGLAHASTGISIASVLCAIVSVRRSRLSLQRSRERLQIVRKSFEDPQTGEQAK